MATFALCTIAKVFLPSVWENNLKKIRNILFQDWASAATFLASVLEYEREKGGEKISANNLKNTDSVFKRTFCYELLEGQKLKLYLMNAQCGCMNWVIENGTTHTESDLGKKETKF